MSIAKSELTKQESTNNIKGLLEATEKTPQANDYGDETSYVEVIFQWMFSHQYISWKL